MMKFVYYLLSEYDICLISLYLRLSILTIATNIQSSLKRILSSDVVQKKKGI